MVNKQLLPQAYFVEATNNLQRVVYGSIVAFLAVLQNVSTQVMVLGNSICARNMDQANARQSKNNSDGGEKTPHSWNSALSGYTGLPLRSTYDERLESPNRPLPCFVFLPFFLLFHLLLPLFTFFI